MNTILRGGATVAHAAHNREAAGSIPAPVTLPTGAEYLDVQGPLLQRATLEQQLSDSRAVAHLWCVVAVVGWVTVCILVGLR